METKSLIIIFISSLLLLFIFRKVVNRVNREYKHWSLNSVVDKIHGVSTEKGNKLKPKKFKYEERTRQIFENLLQADFPKVRPDFMINNKTGKRLELDGFNEKLKLAFEYQGHQHYSFNPYFHKTQQDFENQAYRDKLKKEICDSYGITLIEVPYSVEYDDLEDYIKMKLYEKGLYDL